MKSFRATAMFVATLAVAGLAAPSAQAQVSNVLNSTVVGTDYGIWVVAPTGKVSFCLRLKSGNSGAPLGQCGVLGSIGVAAAGFHINVTDPDLHLVNRSTGVIWHCTVLAPGSGSGIPRGGCSQVSTLSSLQ